MHPTMAPNRTFQNLFDRVDHLSKTCKCWDFYEFNKICLEFVQGIYIECVDDHFFLINTRNDQNKEYDQGIILIEMPKKYDPPKTMKFEETILNVIPWCTHCRFISFEAWGNGKELSMMMSVENVLDKHELHFKINWQWEE